MDLNFTRGALAFNETIFDGSVEQPVSCDMVLPDYCPEISRILKCTVTANVTSTQVTGNRITAEGTAVVRAVYAGEENRVCSFEQSYPFSKYVEIRSMPQTPIISVKAKSEYVNSRAVSQRRIDIHGALSVNFKVERICDSSIISQSEGAGIETLRECIPMCTVAGCAVRTMTLGETAEIEQNMPAVSSIVRVTGCDVISEVKVISNKLLVKGELIVTILYCGDSKLNKHVHTMPISQILEVDGITDDCRCELATDIACLEVIPKKSSGGETRQLEINCRINAKVTAYRETELCSVADVFSTQCELLVEKKPIDIFNCAAKLNESVICNSELDFSDGGIREVVDVWCAAVTAMTPESGAFEVCGTVTLCILYLNSEGQMCLAERQADYRTQKELKCSGKIQCVPQASVTAVNCSPSGNVANARAEIKLTGEVLCSQRRTLITGIVPDEAHVRDKGKPAIIAYFSPGNERVWDVAKRYGIAADRIKRHNNLDSDTIETAALLLIPSV